MFPISKQHAHAYAHLFAPIADSIVLSCLHGVMGELYVDTPKDARCGVIHLGDFCFIGGDAHAPTAHHLLRHLPLDQHAQMLWIPCQKAWIPPLLAIWEGRIEMHARYAMCPPASFDRNRLSNFVADCPAGYVCVPIDAALARQALSMPWSKDLCGNFIDADDFAARGLGMGILHRGQLVAGASSYSVYPGGIEIEIDTHPQHRQKGLARTCAAALVLSCLSRDLTPCWDAANLASVHLATRLGYRFLYSYPAFTPLDWKGDSACGC